MLAAILSQEDVPLIWQHVSWSREQRRAPVRLGLWRLDTSPEVVPAASTARAGPRRPGSIARLVRAPTDKGIRIAEEATAKGRPSALAGPALLW